MRQVLVFAVLLTIFTSVHAQSLTDEAVSLACPVTNSSPTLGIPADANGYAAAIETYLSAGGSVTDLVTTLQARQMLTPQNPTDHPYYGGVWFIDVTGDGYDDALVNIYVPQNQTSALWFYACEGSVYRLVTEVLWHDAPFLGSPRGLYVSYIDDFNADGQLDIAYHTLGCGAFCFESVYVLTWGGVATVPAKYVRRSTG